MIDSCTFFNNTAMQGGALYFYSYGTVQGSTFRNNVASEGMSIYHYNSAFQKQSSRKLLIQDCVFEGHRRKDQVTSVIYCDSGYLELRNSVIRSNNLDTAIVSIQTHCEASMTGMLVENNVFGSEWNLPGVAVAFGRLLVENSIFRNNRGTIFRIEGTAFTLANSYVENCGPIKSFALDHPKLAQVTIIDSYFNQSKLQFEGGSLINSTFFKSRILQHTRDLSVAQSTFVNSYLTIRSSKNSSFVESSLENSTMTLRGSQLSLWNSLIWPNKVIFLTSLF